MTQTITNVPQLKFNKMSNEKYQELLAKGELVANEFYITPDETTDNPNNVVSSYRGEYSETETYNKGDYVNYISSTESNSFYVCLNDNTTGQEVTQSRYWKRLDNDYFVNFWEVSGNDETFHLGLVDGDTVGNGYRGRVKFSQNAPKVNALTGELIGYSTTEEINSSLALKADKETTYTKEEVDTLLNERFQIVDELPENPDPNVFYFIKE